MQDQITEILAEELAMVRGGQLEATQEEMQSTQGGAGCNMAVSGGAWCWAPA